MSALERFAQLTREREETLARVEVAESIPTPTLDAMERIRGLMTALQRELCDLGVKNRMELTLGDITNLMRDCGV